MKIYALLQSIDYLEQVQETIDADPFLDLLPGELGEGGGR